MIIMSRHWIGQEIRINTYRISSSGLPTVYLVLEFCHYDVIYCLRIPWVLSLSPYYFCDQIMQRKGETESESKKEV